MWPPREGTHAEVPLHECNRAPMRCRPLGVTPPPSATLTAPPARTHRLECEQGRCYSFGTRRNDLKHRKGANGIDGDHEARVACRAPGTRKSPETTTANQELALAAKLSSDVSHLMPARGKRRR